MTAETFSQFNTLFTQLLLNKFTTSGKIIIDPNKNRMEIYYLFAILKA